MTVRRWLAAVGAVVTVAGVTLLLAPGLAPVTLDSTLAFVGVGVATACVAALAAFGAIAGEEGTVSTVPDATDRRIPGDEFDEALAAVSAAGRRDPGRHRRAVRERLEAAAVALLVEVEDCSPDDARRRLAEGDWTDDPAAAAFFREDEVPSLSTGDHLRLLAGGDLPFRRRARRVVAALGRLADVDEELADTDGAAGRAASVARPVAGTAPKREET